jgi:hypothetical protein
VTDSKSAPASLTFWNINPSGTHTRATFTYETGKFMNIYFRHDGATAYSYVSCDSAGDLSLFDQTTPEWIEVGVLSDGISYQIDILDDGLNTRVFLDNIEMGSEAVCAAAQYEDQGRVLHNLVTNDIEFETHPYPALGIATDRLVCPNDPDTGTHDTDTIVYFRNIGLPTAATYYRLRWIDDDNHLFVYIASDGSGLLREYSNGILANPITWGAGGISAGDDVTVILDESDAEIFAGGTSIGSTSALNHKHGSTHTFIIQNNATFDSVEFWPRKVSHLLPEEIR